MDAFTSTVKSQVFRLTTRDAFESHFNIQYLYFFGNVNGDSGFMPSDKLELGFYRTLAQFPILAGYLRQRDDGGLDNVVDKDNLNMPVYRETVVDSLHYGDVKAANFDPAICPMGLLRLPPVALPDAETGQIKMANVHVVRFKDNSGMAIFLNVSHSTMDGEGYFSFIKRWSEETYALTAGVPVPDRVFCLDRETFRQSIPKERSEVDEKMSGCYIHPSDKALELGQMTPSARNIMFDKLLASDSLKGGLFRLNSDKLDGLLKQAREFVPLGTRISTNDILVSLISKTVAQATKAASSNKGKSLNSTGVVCNTRHRMGIAGLNYVGNALYTPRVISALAQAETPTTPRSIAEIAIKESFYGVQERYPRSFVGPLVADTSFKLSATISNISRFDMYDANFGFGNPEFVTIQPGRAIEVITIMPVRPPSKDIYVALTNTPQVIEQILQNGAWMEIATLMVIVVLLVVSLSVVAIVGGALVKVAALN
ncbi:hypothetical protein DL89DRAFT_290550 [Linderina pennispora]|uniref:Transferase-domain-containing protein n=1 Tax=Linderina pennispora TaxID=61395 RepID=A0A1Y1WGP5_9FUNG|nr:uncharacterized protein DL89DRAFT_290550 [Linderina pennispora]ORX72703.1 hypothetical protein DL89DRAFT_290550 [Linderina pennispora]